MWMYIYFVNVNFCINGNKYILIRCNAYCLTLLKTHLLNTIFVYSKHLRQCYFLLHLVFTKVTSCINSSIKFEHYHSLHRSHSIYNVVRCSASFTMICCICIKYFNLTLRIDLAGVVMAQLLTKSNIS